MHHNKSILAIIMARGGSKRLPNKNILEFNGKPLIAWTIGAAKKSRYIDRVIVTTDSPQIAEIAKEYGADVPFIRPGDLASDTATSMDTALHALDFIKTGEGKEYDYLAQLQPTSPLRTEKHIDEAIELLLSDENLDAVSSFYVWEKKPQWLHCENENGLLETCLEMKESYVNAKDYLIPNGAIALVKTATIYAERTFYPKKIKAYIMDRNDSADIDTIEDFKLAEMFVKARNQEKKSIFIGPHEINENKKCFIIAEAGVNHNGSLDLALKLIDAAAEIGADAVKFQTFKAEQVVTAEGEMADYQKKNLGLEKKQIEMLRSLELPEDFYPKLIQRCEEKNILFLSTPHGGVESVHFLEILNMAAYKVGSGDLNNYLLLEALAKTCKPIILSTGMSTLQEVQAAVEFIQENGNDQIIVLHCTSNYPCPLEDVNLAAMKTLMAELNLPVGYSDHTVGFTAATASAALGAAAYEFHFTLDKNLPGPDHIASAEPKEAKEKIQAIRQTQMMMGSPIKQATEAEKVSTIKIARKSLVAKENLPAGTIMEKSHLEAKRPANGIAPIHFKKFLGKRLLRDIKKDEQLKFEDITNE